MKDTIVLYPALGSGHLMSMIELGKLILTHHPPFSITIFILTPPTNNNNNQHILSHTQQYIASVTTTFPSINFYYIPPISFPKTHLPPHLLTLELSHQSNHHVQNILQSISKTTNLKAVILDFLTYSASQVTTTLEIPTYFYYTSGATVLSMFIYFPTIHQNATKPIKDLHMPLQIPGLPKNISTDDYPDEAKDPETKAYKVLLDSAKTVRECDGIIVNTFDAIEEKTIKSLKEGLFVPDGITPPIFCIGPLITASYGEDENGCLSWLDSQPSQSVVFLSFGSMGRFSKAQLNAIASGLEKSEQRFLWVVRSELELDELSLDELLPKGFLNRTNGKGKVVKNWAPQREILSHESVGGFVTHCGWNSVLEAVCEGVPMVTWPLYAEQNLNKVILVEEMKVALKLNESKDGFVSENELGVRVKELMNSNKGEEIRQKISVMKISAKKAKEEGGSSLVDLNKLVQLWNKKK
ncbi:UDP-glycosyltransferase 1 [Cicer arietinum]|uniref:Glycosyltransferase n=1 Tax=Cicer arietinum TaxID=3827 RepID=A0A067XTC9_CICAR|nr:UDP-glycosyltransferase 1 [Cicer arietinum]AGU14148.1 UDP-glycosyltransferase [Cicer arietinum]